MNELSWLIYLADVAGSVKTYAGTASVFCLIGAGASMVCALASEGAERFEASWVEILPRESIPAMEHWRGLKNKALGMIKPLLIFAAVAAVITAFTPASGTIYAIAASEMGERVIQSETGDKAIQALNVWLDRQIAGAPKD